MIKDWRPEQSLLQRGQLQCAHCPDGPLAIVEIFVINPSDSQRALVFIRPPEGAEKGARLFTLDEGHYLGESADDGRPVLIVFRCERCQCDYNLHIRFAPGELTVFDWEDIGAWPDLPPTTPPPPEPPEAA